MPPPLYEKQGNQSEEEMKMDLAALKSRAHSAMKRVLAANTTTELEKDCCAAISDLLHALEQCGKAEWLNVSEYDYSKCPTVIAAKEIKNEKTGKSYWRVTEAFYSHKKKAFSSCDIQGDYPWHPDIFTQKPLPAGCSQIVGSGDYSKGAYK